MAGRLVLEMMDGSPIPIDLFPDVDLDELVTIERRVYVKNIGDTTVRKAAAKVSGGFLLVGKPSGPSADLGTIHPGERVPLPIFRPANSERGSKSVTIVLSGLAVT